MPYRKCVNLHCDKTFSCTKTECPDCGTPWHRKLAEKEYRQSAKYREKAKVRWERYKERLVDLEVCAELGIDPEILGIQRTVPDSKQTIKGKRTLRDASTQTDIQFESIHSCLKCDEVMVEEITTVLQDFIEPEYNFD
jgi:hypothetical protein